MKTSGNRKKKTSKPKVNIVKRRDINPMKKYNIQLQPEDGHTSNRRNELLHDLEPMAGTSYSNKVHSQLSKTWLECTGTLHENDKEQRNRIYTKTYQERLKTNPTKHGKSKEKRRLQQIDRRKSNKVPSSNRSKYSNKYLIKLKDQPEKYEEYKKKRKVQQSKRRQKNESHDKLTEFEKREQLKTKKTEQQRKRRSKNPAPSRGREKYSKTYQQKLREHPLKMALHKSKHSQQQKNRRCKVKTQIEEKQNKWPVIPTNERKQRCVDEFRCSFSSKSLQRVVCAVCGEEHYGKGQMKTMKLDKIPNRDLLESPATGSNIYRHGKIVLEPKGLCGTHVNVCNKCNNLLLRRKLPYCSVASMPLGPQPYCFQILTIPEKVLISLYRTKVILLKLQPYKLGSHFAIRGNTITFPHNMSSIVEKIKEVPLSLDVVTDIIKVIFIGKSIPKKRFLKNILTVRRQVVLEALHFLQQNHYMYKDLQLTEKNLKSLPQNDVPKHIYYSITLIQNKADSDNEDLLNGPFIDQPTFIEEPTSLTHSGIIDVEGMEISEEDKKLAAMQKDEPVIAIPHGAIPINEYNNVELWLGSYAHLFPYGMGGPKTVDGKQVTLRTYLKHLLNSCHYQYRKELAFVMAMYNVIHKQEVCLKTALTVRRPLFCKDYADTINSVKSRDLKKALLSKNEIHQLSPSVQCLLKQLHAVGSQIPGTAYAKKSMRKEIHAQMIKLGMPVFFITVSPGDTNSPVMCYLAGSDIDLDSMIDKMLPDKAERAKICSEDPVASAKYYNLVVENVLTKLLAYNHPEGGVLGHVSGYYGTTEEQGRGSLHLHLMVWMKGYPSPTDLITRMKQDEQYRHDVLKYFDSIIKQDVGVYSGKITKEQKDIDKILCRRPCDPNKKNFAKRLKSDLKDLVPLVNTHSHMDSCYKYDSKKCRYGYPRPIVETSYVSETQEIFLKRLDERINNYEEYIMTSVRCNMDIKSIPSGKDCRALAFYITEYQVKNELSTYHTLEILEALLSRLEKTDMEMLSEKKIVKMLNRVLTESEVSAPHVAHLCLGHPDNYASHQFRTANMHLMLSWLVEEENENIELDDNVVTNEVWMNLEKTDEDEYILINQELDYHKRGKSLENMCFYDYVAEIEKTRVKNDADNIKEEKSRGRPMLPRFTYDPSHPQAKSHVQRQRHVKLVPKLSYFPPGETRNKELFCKMMLLLFKPHTVHTDLKENHCSWIEAFSNFQFEECHQKMIENIREMHRGMKEKDEIRERRLEENNSGDSTLEGDLNEYAAILDIDETEQDEYDFEMGPSENYSAKEAHIVDGVNHLMHSNLQIKRFEDVAEQVFIRDIDQKSLNQWNREIQRKREEIVQKRNGHTQEKTMEAFNLNEEIIDDEKVSRLIPRNRSMYKQIAKDVCRRYDLNVKQKEIFWLFINNAIKRLLGEKIEQIIAHMGGMAGSGKSRVIKAIKAFHEETNIEDTLRITSPTGTSAALIDGSTIHSVARIMPSKYKNNKSASSTKLEEIWGPVQLLVCDEVSMVGCHLIAMLSQAVTKGKHTDPSVPFGNVDVLLAGDLKQFKPVGDRALYQQNPTSANVVTQRQINEACGRALWLQLTDAVFLDVPMRQKDFVYSQLLTRVALGKCTYSDYELLIGRLISNPSVGNDERFNDAQVVVHTNYLKQELTKQILVEQTKQFGRRTFSILAKDTHPKYRLSKSTLRELLALPDNKTHGLPGNCLLQLGGKVHLTTNIAVELGLTNGAEGVVEQIIFNDDQDLSSDASRSILSLKHMPKCVLVRFDNSKCSLSGLPNNVVPITPVEMTFKFGRRVAGKFINWTIHRVQFPLVSSNCITSYKSQGKDISPIIVDLCPPNGLPIDSSFSYVLLSRCKSLQDLGILRAFPFEVLTAAPSKELLDEEKRLNIIAHETHNKYRM